MLTGGKYTKKIKRSDKRRRVEEKKRFWKFAISISKTNRYVPAKPPRKS
jgi:hypothetical protein